MVKETIFDFEGKLMLCWKWGKLVKCETGIPLLLCIYFCGVLHIYGVLRDLVPFVQFIKREKHPWRDVTLLKVTLIHGCFLRFLNCTNGTKSCKASHIQRIFFALIQINRFDKILQLLAVSVYPIHISAHASV